MVVSEQSTIEDNQAGRASLSIDGLRKRFGGTVAADVDHLEAKAGELVSLLGPSGCGKTTTLRCIAGLVQPDSGVIKIGGRDITRLPTHQRNLGMVFQNYAIFPHLNVFDNVAYGLENRGISKEEVSRRVAEALQLVELADLGQRFRHQLSGGQQQRVALARAIVYRPDVLLLDEPLSNLDAKLRKSMRFELRRLQQHLGLTTIFVTHDQQEALSMSDTVVVMNQGRIEQVGTPREVYERPCSPFVADFIGSTNLLPGFVRSFDSSRHEAVIEVQGGSTLRVPHERALAPDRPVSLLIKPEKASLVAADSADSMIGGEVVGQAYLGAVTQYHIAVGGRVIEVVQSPERNGQISPGTRVGLAFEQAWLRLIEG